MAEPALRDHLAHDKAYWVDDGRLDLADFVAGLEFQLGIVRGGARLRDQVAVLAHRVKMEGQGFRESLLELFTVTAGSNYARQVGDIGPEIAGARSLTYR